MFTKRGDRGSLSFFREAQKRGQITIFIILAVVIVLGVIVYSVVIGNKNQDVQPYADETLTVIKENTLDCFRTVYVNSLIFAGFQGGYTTVSNGYYNGFVTVPYYYNQGTLEVPSLATIETEIASYVQNHIDSCVDYENTSVVSETLGLSLSQKELYYDTLLEYTFSYTKRDTQVKVAEEGVFFTSDVDLLIEDSDGTKTILPFSEENILIPSQIYAMSELGRYIATSLYDDDESVCLTCVEDIAREQNLQVEFLHIYEPQDELVIISNNITSVPFVFQFLDKYNRVENE